MTVAHVISDVPGVRHVIEVLQGIPVNYQRCTYIHVFSRVYFRILPASFP